MRRLTGLGSASLQRELNRLSEAGWSLLSGSATAPLQSQPSKPVYSELVQPRKTLGVVPVLREALLPLAPGLQAAWVYGSVAKQTDTAQSDIDVMLIGENLLLGSVLELLVPLEAQLGRKINPTCYTSAEFECRRAEPDSFVNRVLAQPILPLIGDAHQPPRVG